MLQNVCVCFATSVMLYYIRNIADDDLSFDTSYASVFTMDYTLNRDCLLRADAMAYICLQCDCLGGHTK